MKRAFKELYDASGDSQITCGQCGLGSVKTNIGHLELAAGIAGVIKVVLQLTHTTLVKSLHCDDINPYIDLKESPFYIVRDTQAWQPLQDAHGQDLPRRAGVSSFGFGGANAHVVIEEYQESRPVLSDVEGIRNEELGMNAPHIIVLSAKTEEGLKKQAQRLLSALRAQRYSEENIADIAYTPQVGRDAMEKRVAVIVETLKELEEKLKAFVEGQVAIEDMYHGQVKGNKETLNVFTTDDDLQKAIDAWIRKGKYAKLLDFWTRGLVCDWNTLYGHKKPRRTSLPTYPFARQRYWIPVSEQTAPNFKSQISNPKTSILCCTKIPPPSRNSDSARYLRDRSSF